MPPLRTKHFYDNSSRILQPSTATLCQPLASSKFNSNTWPTNALPFLLFPGIISQQLQHFSTPNHFRRFPTPNHFPKISQTFCYHVASLNHNQSPVSQRPQSRGHQDGAHERQTSRASEATAGADVLATAAGSTHCFQQKNWGFTGNRCFVC